MRDLGEEERKGKECENLMIFDRWIFGDDYFFWDFDVYGREEGWKGECSNLKFISYRDYILSNF